ncbi:glycoside hydrolase family 127 protein [Auraticoccus sp. F435]|uniref:Glycoside hydrolase family 127 protein n=1 Tax=Auraticoccus cholistanensis TaxID=2656650 RepID=A0A6A9V0E1_9ACTN|nr:beta-L-arabinofuranosidase domain-containing protein [Auraticoccus cholistanensis]MVA75260.1 glycoside hydrolase family 127 protein [Auraticoccus cholistanensis]
MSTAAPTTGPGLSPARPTESATGVSTPLGLDRARITGGFWLDRQQAVSTGIRAGYEQLERAGNLQNLRIAAGQAEGEAVGPIFADSDVYKWLEAVAWELAREPDDDLLALQREVTAVVAAAQQEDGYLDSVVQVRLGPEGRYTDLPWSHEHYCAGHLIQAAVAQVRCTGDRELLEVAVRLADHLVATFGEDRRHDVDGHPVIEMALVELYRETGNRDYLELARYFVDARGHGLMASYGKEPAYFSDRVPVREATTVEGHAVRAVYLTAGATDLAAETGDESLLTTLDGQFANMWAAKTYVTGGFGSRWDYEAFGEPYELTPDRAYAETCASIGVVQWAWRMLLATGRPSYGDAIERILFNGFLAGVSLGGAEYFYVNPLQLRGGSTPDENRSPAHGRRGWFACACCPPNVMRTMASLAGLLASRSEGALEVHQYATASLDGGGLAVDVVTDYPWTPEIRLTVTAVDDPATELRLRVPAWATGATVSVRGEERPATPGGYATVSADWRVGDEVVLTLPLQVRTVTAHPRVDAVRGCVALERGPLVYTFEHADQPAGVELDDIALLPGTARAGEHRSDLLAGVTPLNARGRHLTAPDEYAAWPWPTDGGSPRVGEPVDLVAVPYYAWANREIDAMRVWVPLAPDGTPA